jgi:uncharacterized protein
MKFRVSCAAAAAALLLSAAPASAQRFSDSYEFLNAVRKADGSKVNKFLQDKTLRIINIKDRSTGEGALHIAAKRRDALYLRVFLQQDDVNRNLRDGDGNTALLLAVAGDWADGVDILLKYSVDVNMANNGGETPLIRAVQIHDAGIVEKLLKAGADPDRGDFGSGKSARDYAREDTRYPAIARLLADAPKKGSAAAAGPRL